MVNEPATLRFRYTLPDAPVAGAAVDIGRLGVRIDLALTGGLDVTGVGSTVDSVRACALQAVRGMASGVMVRGLGSATPAVSSMAGHVFTQLHHEFPAARTVVFAGRCEIDFGRRYDSAEVTVRGTAGYSLAVTVVAPPASPVPAGRNWFAHDGELASIGMVVLVAVPTAPARLVAAESA